MIGNKIDTIINFIIITANLIASLLCYMIALSLVLWNLLEIEYNDFQWIVIFMLFAIFHNISCFGMMNK